MSGNERGRTLIVVGAGGTAGHVVPAIAVARELRARGAAVSFLGGSRAEAELVPAAGFPFKAIPTAGLDRTNPLRALRGAARALVGVGCAAVALRRLRPSAVYAAGGYVGATVGFAAVALRIPVVVGEADSHLGLGNRLLAPFARRLCLAFPIPGREGGRYRVCGRPLPARPVSREQARASLGLAPDAPYVVVFGGSLGARSLNEAALAVLGRLGVAVLHVAGVREYDRLASRPLPDGYRLERFLAPEELSLHLSAADLAICRAGGSVLEVAAHGVPLVVVPYPLAAADHQRSNARYLVQRGAAVAVEDDALPEGLAAAVKGLLEDRGRLAEMARAARALSPPDAAAAIAEEVLEAGGWSGP